MDRVLDNMAVTGIPSAGAVYLVFFCCKSSTVYGSAPEGIAPFLQLFAGNWIGTVVAMLGSQGSAGMAGYGATVGLSFRIVECQDQDPIAR